MAYFTGQPKGSLGASGKHFPEATGSCCSGCASGSGGCGGHSATGDVQTNLIGIGLVVGLVWIATKTMNKVAG